MFFTRKELEAAVISKSTGKNKAAVLGKFNSALSEYLAGSNFADLKAYISGHKELDEYAASTAIQYPERTFYAMYVPLGYLLDALDLCNDQNPIDIQLVRNLFDKPEYGVFHTGNLKQDIEICYEADNIVSEEGATDDEGSALEVGSIIDESALYIKGGRHRTAFIATVLHLLGLNLDEEHIRNLLIRVRVSTVESLPDLAQMQVLSNVTRSMGVAEKSRGRLVRNDVDIDDARSVLTAAYKSGSATGKTDAYRTLFAHLLRTETATLKQLTPNTAAEIGSAFYTQAKKLAEGKQKAMLSFSNKFELTSVVEFHETILEACVDALTDLVADTVATNLAREAKALGRQLADRLAAHGFFN